MGFVNDNLNTNKVIEKHGLIVWGREILFKEVFQEYYKEIPNQIKKIFLFNYAKKKL